MGRTENLALAETEAEAQSRGAIYGSTTTALTRDEDVLDTWFSSALWPFSTLGLAGQDAGAGALLSDQRAGHRLRHHLLLGRPHDDDGPAFHEGRSAVPRRLHPPPGARRLRRQDVEVEGQRRRSARRHRRVRRRRAALHLDAQRRARATTSGSGRRTSRTTAISRPSCGTPRALSNSTAPAASKASIRNPPRKRSTAGSRTKPRRRRPRSRRRSKLTASAKPPARPIALSGTSIATGMSNCRSRC